MWISQCQIRNLLTLYSTAAASDANTNEPHRDTHRVVRVIPSLWESGFVCVLGESAFEGVCPLHQPIGPSDVKSGFDRRRSLLTAGDFRPGIDTSLQKKTRSKDNSPIRTQTRRKRIDWAPARTPERNHRHTEGFDRMAWGNTQLLRLELQCTCAILSS